MIIIDSIIVISDTCQVTHHSQHTAMHHNSSDGFNGPLNHGKDYLAYLGYDITWRAMKIHVGKLHYITTKLCVRF